MKVTQEMFDELLNRGGSIEVTKDQYGLKQYDVHHPDGNSTYTIRSTEVVHNSERSGDVLDDAHGLLTVERDESAVRQELYDTVEDVLTRSKERFTTDFIENGWQGLRSLGENNEKTVNNSMFDAKTNLLQYLETNGPSTISQIRTAVPDNGGELVGVLRTLQEERRIVTTLDKKAGEPSYHIRRVSNETLLEQNDELDNGARQDILGFINSIQEGDQEKASQFIKSAIAGRVQQKYNKIYDQITEGRRAFRTARKAGNFGAFLEQVKTSRDQQVYRIDDFKQAEQAFKHTPWDVQREEYFNLYPPPYYMVVQNGERVALATGNLIVDANDRPSSLDNFPVLTGLVTEQ